MEYVILLLILLVGALVLDRSKRKHRWPFRNVSDDDDVNYPFK